MRPEGFSCSLDVLYGGLGKSKLQFLNKKDTKNFPAVFFLQILDINTPNGGWIRVRIHLKCWNRIRIQIRINWIRIHNSGLLAPYGSVSKYGLIGSGSTTVVCWRRIFLIVKKVRQWLSSPLSNLCGIYDTVWWIVE